MGKRRDGCGDHGLLGCGHGAIERMIAIGVLTGDGEPAFFHGFLRVSRNGFVGAADCFCHPGFEVAVVAMLGFVHSLQIKVVSRRGGAISKIVEGLVNGVEFAGADVGVNGFLSCLLPLHFGGFWFHGVLRQGRMINVAASEAIVGFLK